LLGIEQHVEDAADLSKARKYKRYERLCTEICPCRTSN
jgi:hypothetical protein